eukprot:TRINITY_DN3661_c0_g1_i1.p1 TRINITY_DN3661_c0_g1~~TRINITY_DN3661_c0_g1_i1.p1  ORF type:complete len:674 (-),score=103.18 TRINITY_DN3661_c0_g1_i1:155-2176(-)
MATKLLNNKFLYNTKDLLGTGSFGKVYKGTILGTNEVVAIKAIDWYLVKKHGDTLLKATGSEVNTLQKLSSISTPYIVKIYDCFDTGSYIYLILEYCDQGTTDDILEKKKKIPEEEALKIIFQVVSAVDILHQAGITHRDIKPENIFIKGDSFKLGDFGFASEVKVMSEFMGTYPYMAPEIFDEQYDKGVDVWAIGVMLHQYLTGDLYFMGRNQREVMEAILNKEYVAPDIASDIVKDLLRRTLVKDPKLRITISDMKAHPCFSRFNSSTSFMVSPRISGSPATTTSAFATPINLQSYSNFLSNNSPATHSYPYIGPSPTFQSNQIAGQSQATPQSNNRKGSSFGPISQSRSMFPSFHKGDQMEDETFERDNEERKGGSPMKRSGTLGPLGNLDNIDLVSSKILIKTVYPTYQGKAAAPGQSIIRTPEIESITTSRIIPARTEGETRKSLIIINPSSEDMILYARNYVALLLDLGEMIWSNCSEDKKKHVFTWLTYRMAHKLIFQLLEKLKQNQDPAELFNTSSSDWARFKSDSRLLQRYIRMVEHDNMVIENTVKEFLAKNQKSLKAHCTGVLAELLILNTNQFFEESFTMGIQGTKIYFKQKLTEESAYSEKRKTFLKICCHCLIVQKNLQFAKVAFDFGSYFSRIDYLSISELASLADQEATQIFISAFY